MTLKVNVSQNNGFVFVKPACLSVLSDQLTYLRSSFEFSFKDRKRVMTKTPTQVYSYDESSDTLSAPAGVKDRILKALKAAGYSVSFTRTVVTPEERRKLVTKNVDMSVFRPEQISLLEAIVANTHTTGKAATGAGKSFLIGYICKMYPNAKIVITTDAADVVRTLKTYLETTTGEKIGQIGASKNIEERVTVATLKSLHKIKSLPDILIIDECHVIGTDSYASACLVASREAFKVVGLSASPLGRGDNAWLVIESICGPLRADISYQTSVKNGSVAQLNVDVYQCNKGPGADTTSLIDVQADKDRVAIWRNTDRNKLIQSIIGKELRENPDDQVLVYTERTEHALALLQVLKPYGFVLVHGATSAEAVDFWKSQGLIDSEEDLCTVKRREEIRQKFRTTEIKRVICTRVWQKGVDFPKLKILLRADASASEITADQASGRLSRTDSGNKTVAKVIDIEDSFNPTYKRRYAERQSVYEARGWKIKKCQV